MSNCSGILEFHAPAGCVAVAMAQIMKYHEYPAANNPIPGYDDPSSYYEWRSPITSYGSISSIGVTTYDWGHMPNNINLT